MSPKAWWEPPRRIERRGIIARLDRENQCGHIQDARELAPVFFHRSNLEGVRFEELTEGQTVFYLRVPELGGAKYRARHVRL